VGAAAGGSTQYTTYVLDTYNTTRYTIYVHPRYASRTLAYEFPFLLSSSADALPLLTSPRPVSCLRLFAYFHSRLTILRLPTATRPFYITAWYPVYDGVACFLSCI